MPKRSVFESTRRTSNDRKSAECRNVRHLKALPHRGVSIMSAECRNVRHLKALRVRFVNDANAKY